MKTETASKPSTGGALSRRRVLGSGALMGLGLAGASLIGCSSSDETATPVATTAASGSASTATAVAAEFKGVTGEWDTTGTPPYLSGLPDDKADIPEAEAWRDNNPWLYKFGQWRYNWDVPVTRGGTYITHWAPPPNFDIMISGISAQPAMNKLFQAGLREGVDLFSVGFERELAQTTEVSPDLLTWTITIPPDVKFQNLPPVNGRLLTAEDVKFSFERHMDEGLNRTILRNVDRVEAVDATTVRFVLKKPHAAYDRILATPHFVIFSQEQFEDYEALKEKPIGTGPFILDFHEYQNRDDWVRNPDYWEKPPIKPEKYGTKAMPFVDKYVRQYFANPVTAKEAFFNGEIDYYAYYCSGNKASTKEILERVPDALIMVNQGWSCCPEAFSYQMNNPLFQDIRVRQALSMGIDRTQIWRDSLDQLGQVGGGPIPIDLLGLRGPRPLEAYGPNVQHNPKEALALLKAAGVEAPLKFQLYQSQALTQTVHQGIIDTVLFQWKNSGVADVTKVIRDAQVASQDLINKSYPDMFYASNYALGYTLDSLVAPAFLTDSPRNAGSIKDPDLDALFEKWTVTPDEQDRFKIAMEIDTHVIDNMEHIFTGWWPAMDVTRHWAQGHVISAHNCHGGIGQGNFKYMWMAEDAPGGRGGKNIV